MRGLLLLLGYELGLGGECIGRWRCGWRGSVAAGVEGSGGLRQGGRGEVWRIGVVWSYTEKLALVSVVLEIGVVAFMAVFKC